MSSSISWGKVPMSCVLRRSLADELVQQHAGDHVERLENALAFVGCRREGWYLDISVIEQKLHILQRSNVRQIALVVLEHVRDFCEVQLQRFEVLLEIGKALDILRHLLVLRIG